MAKRALTLFAAVAGMFSSSATYGQPNMFRDWAVGVTSDKKGVFAATVNESGGVFGEYCYPSSDTCFWLLSNETTCDDGNTYPVLVNTDTGSATTTIVCKKVDGKARYVFASYREIESSIKGARWLGMAFPMESGRFQVSRFSLAGASEAVSFMERTMKAAVNRASQSTEDEVL
jgi:hypothetical protein